MSEIQNPDNPTLEKLIREVDYVKMGENYIPSKFAIKFINFIKLVNGESGEENKSPLSHYDILDAIYKNKNVLIVSFRGSSKALALDTLLMTPTGHVSMGDVEIGDYVLDRNGKPTKVTHTSEVFYNQTYTITLANGESFVANEDHIHIVQYRTTANNGNTKENRWKEVELTTKELLDKGIYYLSACTEKKPKGRENKYFIPLINKAVEYDSVPFDIDPYTVGVVLGDGHYQRNGQYISITSSKDDVAELMSYLPYEKNKVLEDKRQPNTVSFGLKGLGHLWDTEVGDFKRENKKIPEGLLYGSVEDRVAVLRGLMDTDGTISENGAYSFSSTSEGLARGVHHIVKSLGGYSRISRYENAYKGYYLVAFNLQDINPFRLKRKADRWVKGKRYLSGSRVAIESIEPTEKPVPSKCISVESDTCSYLIENSIVTHNTTLVAEYMILYQAVFGELDGFGKVTVGMYVGDTMENGVKNLRANLEHRYNNSEFLQKFIVHARFTDVEWEFTNAEGHKLCYRGFGASTGVRGFKKYGERPQFAILDDLMSDKSAESKTIIKDIENVIYKAVRQAMHPTKRKVIWIGTPFNKKDPLYKAAGTKAWTTKAYPICMQFPCTKENFVGAWEDRFPYEAVRAEYDMLKENGRVDAFNQELMLRILSDDDRLVLDEDIVWYTRNTVLNNLQDYNIYITTDFATSEKEKADFSVISVWALDWKGRFHWIDGIVKRQDMAVNVDDVFRFVQLYAPLLTGVEISGQQKGFVSWLKREMIIRGIYFMIASDKSSGEEGLRPNTSKLTRFNVALPLFKQRKIAFPEELKESAAILEFIDELSSVTPSGFKSLHDDCADTISQLPLIEYFTPIDPKFKRVEERSIGSENNYYFTEPQEEYKSSYIV